MATLDLDALTEQAAERALEKQRDLVRAVVREELARASTERIMSRVQLAEYLGISAKALGMRLARGSALTAIRFALDGKEVWRKSDVDALLSAAKAAT
jgi:hypothetical protein